MMASDEAGTLAALKRHREVIFDPAVTQHRGRIVKLMGDGTLVEFGSVVDAVNCALTVQRFSSPARPEGDPPIVLRIGINLGDIIIEGDDIYGDGVNIAARLEPLAEPGGICVASVVNDNLGSRIDVRFRDAGEVKVKNIERPIRIWKWHPTDSAGESHPSAVPSHAERGGLPLLAVLPFQNMSGDADQEYFADGVVEDLITALSRFKSFAVIARNSSFVYKRRAVDVRQFAREVGVRYVVEGSVRRSGNRLRIAAQLLDGTNGAHLWAHNFDGAVEDVFDVQDRITEGVVAVVEPKVQRAEIDRSRRERPESLDAYDLYLRALQKINTSRPDDNAAGLGLLDRAIAQEPGYAVALALAANGLQHRLTMGWPAMTDDDEGKCLRLAWEALAIGGDDPMVLARCGLVLLLVGHEYDRGLQILKRALAANPNDVLVLSHTGIANVLSGSLDEAVALLHRAIDLSPGDAWSGMTGLAEAHLCLGQYEDALEWAGRSLAENPNFNVTYWILIAAKAHLGRMDEARQELATLQAMAPGVSIARLGLHAKDQRSNDVITEGLRLAGMPEV
jgi:TolB-like protein